MRDSSRNALGFYLGELMLAPYCVAPDGFLPCDGRLLSTTVYVALYSLLGTKFGGNGVTTFALPDLRGRAPIGAGHGATHHAVGEMGGSPEVQLLPSHAPSHTHRVFAAGGEAVATAPAGGFFAASPSHYGATPDTYMSGAAVSIAGGNLPHENMMPSIALHWLIAVDGEYPPRPASLASTEPEGEK